jgi:hypothetical protein
MQKWRGIDAAAALELLFGAAGAEGIAGDLDGARAAAETDEPEARALRTWIWTGVGAEIVETAAMETSWEKQVDPVRKKRPHRVLKYSSIPD